MSLPLGPNMSTEQFYAPSRLGFSMFVCRTMTPDRGEHVTTLISRVLEKTSSYGAACFETVYDQQRLGDYRSLRQWSDGPKQFKSLEMLATCVRLIPEFKLKQIQYDYGCPCHWKGPWDTFIGIFKNVLYQFARRATIHTLEEVQVILTEWAAMRKPGGTPMSFQVYMPPPKSSMDREHFVSSTVGGIDTSFSWSFTLNDKRGQDNVRGSGLRINECLKLDCRNHGLTNQKAAGKSVPFIDPSRTELAVDGADGERAELHSNTKIHEGWKVSYITAVANRVQQRRQHLSQITKALEPQLAAMPEVGRHRPRAAVKQAVLANQACKRKRQSK